MSNVVLRAAIAAVCLAAPAQGQTVVFVNASLATGANDGTSWANAYRGRLGLKAALDATLANSNTQLWVAKGSYAPAAANGDKLASFALKNGVGVYGGFAGTESSIAQRNPGVNVTILSGDLNQNDAAQGRPTTQENSHHVVRADNCDATALLDGVTVKHGDATQHGSGDVIDREGGGGILVMGGSPTISNCVITLNIASWFGGGVACVTAFPTINNSTLSQNRCQAFGAGLAAISGSSPIVSSCRFDANNGALGTGAYVGPVAGQPAGANAPTFTDCQFLNGLGNLSAAQGGGVYLAQDSTLLDRCEFRANTCASVGGGAALSSSNATVRNCRFVANVAQADPGNAIGIEGGSPSILGCVLTGNHGPNFPFSFDITLMITNGATPLVSNCTIANNGSATGKTAVMVSGNTTATLHNCVLWGNVSSAGTGEAAAVQKQFGGTVTLDHCDVQGWTGTLPGQGNFGADPLFTDRLGADGVAGTTDDDFSLQSTSPCIDAGANAAVPAQLAVDVRGRPRLYDAPVPDSGSGSAPLVDIGAYEFTCPADLDADNVVDLNDFFAFLNFFDASDPGADVTGDGAVDLNDFFGFLNAFDAGC